MPTDLKSSSYQISKPENRIYLARFLKSLRAKMRQKAALLPGQIDVENLELLRDFPQFDDRFTAPMHGFKSADDYYEQSSSGRYLATIAIPTLLVNAENDPFLAPSCFPRDVAAASKFVFLETPPEGGHVGFAEGTPDGEYYSERRAVEFLMAEVPA
ncbi:YheT family hydrolase [Hymenobacter cellulosilyticus]|uniref:Alpha/beta hydrolase n=1 Tax=Hymenobacter cellulosilyticus TaxID=2932248 RepID=A0A8T9QFL9_9BACT|nr:hypothetical protein [Hymenobacter cellulosilyticus]UOQ74349.1 hypothetical protein MUN79_10960 [Hymenobacter cellulosilyticus]